MRVGEQTMTINMFNTITYMGDHDECHCLEDLEDEDEQNPKFCYSKFIEVQDFI